MENKGKEDGKRKEQKYEIMNGTEGKGVRGERSKNVQKCKKNK